MEIIPQKILFLLQMGLLNLQITKYLIKKSFLLKNISIKNNITHQNNFFYLENSMKMIKMINLNLMYFLLE